jgi:hypothetical protein
MDMDKEIKSRPWIENSYEEMQKKFYKKAKHLIPTYDKIVSEEYSSERMGGWIVRDTADMMIGWVGNLGDVKVYDYEPTTKANANSRNFRT